MRACEEMKKLRNYLDRNEIPYCDNSDDLTKICRTRFEIGEVNISVIHGRSTYGGIDGLLELAMWDEKGGSVDPTGWLSAKDVICVIKELGKNGRRKKKTDR